MKKLFVSVPMKNREPEKIKESIEKMHKIAEIIFGEELEVIDSYMEGGIEVDFDVKNWSIYFLSESIMAMANADYFIGVDDHYEYSGCNVETLVARNYGIPMFLIESRIIAEDAFHVSRMGNTCCIGEKGV